MRKWFWVAIASVAIAGCDPEPEGSVLRPPTESEARALEEKKQQEMAFRPGVYQGSATAATGNVSIRAEFRSDMEASITRNLTGANSSAEIMKGSYTVVDNIVEVSVTEVNGETTQFPLFFFEEVNGISTQDIAEGNTVRVFLERVSTTESAATDKPQSNAPANAPATNVPPASNSPQGNAPPETPSNAPAEPVEPELPLASGVSFSRTESDRRRGSSAPATRPNTPTSQLRA